MGNGDGNNKVKISAGMLTIAVLLVFQIIGFSFGYGLLTQQVQFNRELIERYHDGQSDVLHKIEELSDRIVQLEITLTTLVDD